MKIVLTIGDLSIRGGAERVVVNFAEALCENGHRVEILSFYRSNEVLPYVISPQTADNKKFILKHPYWAR